MKTLTVFFALSLSLSSFASGLDTFRNVMDQKEVEELTTKLAEKGFALTTVTDRYAASGVRPRCICESFEVTFTKYSGVANKIEKYGISVTGFGSNQQIKIDKIK